MHPPIFPIIVCYISPSLFVIRISNIQNAKISRGCPLKLVGPHGMLTHFQGLNDPRRMNTPHFADYHGL